MRLLHTCVSQGTDELAALHAWMTHMQTLCSANLLTTNLHTAHLLGLRLLLAVLRSCCWLFLRHPGAESGSAEQDCGRITRPGCTTQLVRSSL